MFGPLHPSELFSIITHYVHPPKRAPGRYIGSPAQARGTLKMVRRKYSELLEFTEVSELKRLIIRWVVGLTEGGQPIYRRQVLNVPDEFGVENAQTVVEVFDKYSKYTCGGAELQVTQSVGDAE